MVSDINGNVDLTLTLNLAIGITTHGLWSEDVRTIFLPVTFVTLIPLLSPFVTLVPLLSPFFTLFPLIRLVTFICGSRN